ncbi:MAG: hypothetical protein Kow00124_16790 [Anaerolineae bacterium]
MIIQITTHHDGSGSRQERRERPQQAADAARGTIAQRAGRLILSLGQQLVSVGEDLQGAQAEADPAPCEDECITEPAA